MFSLLNIRVGWFLAWRQVRRTSRWTTSLIVFVMLLTFLNLVAVSGLLVGIVDGISNLYRQQETGDVILKTPVSKNYIEHSSDILAFLKTLPQVKNIAPRYVSSGMIEANYKTRTDYTDKPNETAAVIVGVDIEGEQALAGVASYIGEGSYFAPGDYDQIIIGSQLVDRYAFGGDIFPNISVLRNVYPGTKVRVTINGQTREMTVKGIIVTTANSPLAAKVLIPGYELRQLMGRDDFNLSQIAIDLNPGTDPGAFTSLLKRSGVGADADVLTYTEAIPNGVDEVRRTFQQIGTAISSVGLVVASITIFIVIFINALTRRKFIGILKAIGISGEAIEIAYMFQSFFYAAVGSAIGLAILYGFLVPYISAHPIVLPISHAILVAPIAETIPRVILLVVATVIAGYLPARMIVRKNTLDSILGRE
ncbi:FtsX-like permease family protein [Candidatus Kaiserbacteria bacterium]|nr:FtsX-like permease family protein [Candidatus Kaiserbacteria bacterium]